MGIPWMPGPYSYDPPFLQLVTTIKELAAKYPRCAAATGILTGSVLISSCYNRSLKEFRSTTDLTGKTVIITDGDQGIGKATAVEFARRNAEVIIGSKNVALASQVVKEIKAATGNDKIRSKQLDLCSFKSIENFVDDLYTSDLEVNVLINNAEYFPGTRREITEDGCERTMQSNYLGPFLLTTSLVDLMEKGTPENPKKIINVTSMCHQCVSLDVEDLSASYNYSPLDQYLKSKQACMLFTTELSTKLQRKVLTVNAVNPGLVKTKLENATFLQGFIMKILYYFYGKTPAQGAQTILYVALSPELHEVSGKYFRNCKERKLQRADKDRDLATKLFKLSEDIVDFKF